MNHMNEDPLKKTFRTVIETSLSYHNLYWAIEPDLMVTKVEQDLDYSMVIVVDLIAIDFVLVDSFVDVVALMTSQEMMNFKKTIN